MAFAIQESGFKIEVSTDSLYPQAVVELVRLDWRGRVPYSTTFYMIIITSTAKQNRVVPYSRLVFNRQDTGKYGKSLWRRGI